jgi:aminoglycoside phosphotransferase (APT) family kinase protein
VGDQADVRGLDTSSVSRWLREHLHSATGPFEFSLIAAGGSNLTYRVVDSTGAAYALRRPPEGTTLATAHDVDREWRIMSALDAAGVVPVPPCLVRCDDVEVTGAPFYVMGFVDGTILRTSADASSFTPAEAATATESLIAGQVAFHTLDLEGVGLADLGRHDAYVERQLKRWKTQVERADARPVPLVHELHAKLSARVPPEQVQPGLAHGDYRFDNVVLAADRSLAAILDWELCTTGNPLADFAWSMQYWADPDDEFTWLADAPTQAGVFPRQAAVISQYGSTTGFDLSDYPYYEAFSWWKHACIVEGVYARRLRGSTGGMTQGPISDIADRVDTMLERAHSLVEALD